MGGKGRTGRREETAYRRKGKAHKERIAYRREKTVYMTKGTVCR